MKRKIIKIDEEKCTGCGDCVVDCAEGALQIVDGKAKLVKDALCDGLGACMGTCPTGALMIEERDAEAFDEEEVEKHLVNQQQGLTAQKDDLPCGCPGSMAKQWDKPAQSVAVGTGGSALRQWPVQLHLLNPAAPYFDNADLVIAADCVPFSYPNFHKRFLQGKILAVFCPKLDQGIASYIEKLTEILTQHEIKSITTIHMEVPCCSGTVKIAEEALRRSGKQIIMKDYTISLKGEIV